MNITCVNSCGDILSWQPKTTKSFQHKVFFLKIPHKNCPNYGIHIIVNILSLQDDGMIDSLVWYEDETAVAMY